MINVLRTRERNQYALSTFCLFNNGRIGIRSQDHQSSRLRSYLCAMEAAEDLPKLWIFLLHSSNRFFVNDQEDEVRFPPGAPNCGCMGECASSHPKVGFYKPRLALHSSHLISSPLDIYKYVAKECGLFVSAILVGCFSCGAQCAKEIVLLQKLSLNFVKSPRECSRIHRKVTLRRARVYCRLLEGCHPPRRMYPGGSNVHP